MSIIIDSQRIDYEYAIQTMENIVDKIIKGGAKDTIWLIEHIPIYTIGYTTYSEWIDRYGTSINNIPLVESSRGGQITYHGPGQRVCYCMIDLNRLYGSLDLRRFLNDIHRLIIDVLADFKIMGFKDDSYEGVWVKEGNVSNKIAAIGIKVRKGVTYHGFALNVNTDISNFDLIEPCGIKKEYGGVTSLSKVLGEIVEVEAVDLSIVRHLGRIFKIDSL
jgi:lipoyl(octanoyl) transferase